ncbi:hypothetical protein ACN20G_21750 [Streptomyces sp. BI20]|uniref:hypothetical protein n=1 Tax=Streptomyces sp. BI20 TaxID=3403460 RepID=UPI003C707DF3
MSRRVSLPGADELFRTTGGMALSAPAGSRRAGDEATPEEHGTAVGDASRTRPRGPEEADTAEPTVGAPRRPQEGSSAQAAGTGAAGAPRPVPGASGASRRKGRGGRRPSGRERHDEKITVYVSAEELMDLEHARLVLRGEHGLAVDRGRIVREAVAVVLADLESRGDASILVRRLRGR